MRALIHAALVTLALAGCGRARGDVREWRPEDHDSGVTSGAPVTPRAPSNPTEGGMGAARAIFQTQCASCHGEQGHADGPMSAMFRATDLSAQGTQAKSDDDLARAISAGRGRMPAFGERMPPEAISLLVRLIRTFR